MVYGWFYIIFFDQLQKSGRKVMVVMIPEHGANMTGDKLQMPWLRDLPSLTITHVPLGIKLIGMKAPHPDNAQQVNTSTSYLALPELISRMVDGKVFNATNVDWQALTKNLPETPIVSENEATVVMEYQGKPYIRLDANADWVPYPQDDYTRTTHDFSLSLILGFKKRVHNTKRRMG